MEESIVDRLKNVSEFLRWIGKDREASVIEVLIVVLESRGIEDWRGAEIQIREWIK